MTMTYKQLPDLEGVASNFDGLFGPDDCTETITIRRGNISKKDGTTVPIILCGYNPPVGMVGIIVVTYEHDKWLTHSVLGEFSLIEEMEKIIAEIEPAFKNEKID